MPKKTRKAKVRAAQRPIKSAYPIEAPVPQPQTVRQSLTPRASPSSALAARSAAPLTFDYTYVYRDLRRIGLLAGTFFVLMLIIWFLVEVQGIHIIPGLL